MNVLLFGVSNVGKTTVGEILAKKLGLPFHDLDDEVRKEYQVTQEQFVHTGTLRDRDMKRSEVLETLLWDSDGMVVAVSPLSYIDYVYENVLDDSVVSIELRDTPEHIFERLVFSDENDVVYKDDAYKNEHKAYYLKEIQKDLDWYGSVNSVVKYRYDMNGETPEEVAEGLMRFMRECSTFSL